MGFLKVLFILFCLFHGFLVLLALIRVAYQRLLFFLMLKSTVRQISSITVKANPMRLLSWNKATKPSFVVETPDIIYVVKLCGALRRTDAFVFVDKSYWIKRQMIRGGRETAIKPRPLIMSSEIKMSYKQVKLIYLFTPKSLRYFKQVGNQVTRILPGDIAHDGAIHDADSFLSLLRNDAERRQQLYEVL